LPSPRALWPHQDLMARLSLEPSGTLIPFIDGPRAGGSLQGVFHVFQKFLGKVLTNYQKYGII